MHELVHKFTKFVKFLRHFKVSFRCSFVNKTADKTVIRLYILKFDYLRSAYAEKIRVISCTGRLFQRHFAILNTRTVFLRPRSEGKERKTKK